jgi:formamidopyrimidine-DNA glycosylase
MPELPDIVVYLEALERRVLGHRLQRIQIASPFLVRTAAPPISDAEGKQVVELRRLGKRICIGIEDELWLVLHLMIAGRLHWKDEVAIARLRGPQPGSRAGVGRSGRELDIAKSRTPLLTRGLPPPFPKAQLATFQFDNGTLSLTEAGTQRRASLHLVKGDEGLKALDPGGVEVLDIGLARFAELLKSENHTLKRALTDPHSFSGIGNAYSDEILWSARLSPVKLTQRLSEEELARLYHATRKTLTEWVERLREVTGDQFPEKVTAFREGMAVHGRYKEACPRCGAKVQRIRYATNETNYCPKCQTGGKLLADRALSRILRDDWPKTAEELG